MFVGGAPAPPIGRTASARRSLLVIGRTLPRQWLVMLVLSTVPLVQGCLSFARGYAGVALSPNDTPGHSGPVVGTDATFSLSRIRWVDGKSAFPLGLHNSFEILLAPERKDFAWGTGLAYFGSPRPVSGHVIVGTNLHAGKVEGEFTLGNVSPYLQLGVRASLSSDASPSRREGFLSFDVSGQTYIDYLSLTNDGELVTTLVCLKFGIGFGH
jgi:hypothetical protein